MVLQFGVNATGTKKIGNIEHRLLLTLFFFALFGVISLVNLAIAGARADKFLNITKQYVSCEASGPSLGSCDYFKQDVDLHGFYYLGAVNNTLIGLMPVAILIFIIDWRYTGKIVKKILLCGRQHSSHCHDNQRSAAISTFSPAPITSVSNW